MKPTHNLLLLILFVFILESCNTLYHYKMIDIEVARPARVIFSEQFSKAAIRYNNAFDPNQDNKYFYNAKSYTDFLKLDTTAAKIYFDSTVQTLKQQFYFDSVVRIEDSDYANVLISDSLIQELDTNLVNNNPLYDLHSVAILGDVINLNQIAEKKKQSKRMLDPVYGLYTKKEISQIADSTGADILISLDYFAATDIESTEKMLSDFYAGNLSVFGTGIWNFYNLKTLQPELFFIHLDTIMWNTEGGFYKSAENQLPPRRDAVLIAAELMGVNMADILIPHWIPVQRLYYTSGHPELKQTEKMILEGKWLDATEIWKANIDNSSKSIAAKSMFNLGVACEMQGDLEAAIDWVVRSFYVFGTKNEAHYINCVDYLNILGQRRVDLRLIEKQIGSDL